MKPLLQIWFWSLLIKLAIAAWIPLAHDETYYWVWSHHLQLSYFDHPPFVAWLFRLGHPLEYFLNAVRFPAVLFGHLTLLIWVLIFKKFLPSLNLRWWMILALFSPLIGPGSLIITPDVPLMFFWALSLYFFLCAVEKPDPWTLILLGLAMGLGFASKYHMALFAICALAYIFTLRAWHLLRPRVILITTIFFLLGSAPVWIWNFQNDFVSFLFQLNHGLGESRWKPAWTVAYVLGQIGLIFPVVFWAALPRSQVNQKNSWLHLFAWIPLIFFFLTSFKGHVEANWPAVAYPSLVALALLTPWFERWRKTMVAIWAICLVIVITDIQWTWVPLPERYLKTREFREFDRILPIVDQYQPLFVRRFQMAAKLSYELKKPVFKLYGMSRTDYYDFLPQSVPSTPKYFVAVRKGEHLPMWAQHKGHQIVQRIPIDHRFEIMEVNRPGDSSP